eukprot:TRINITY_DN48163_c0_g1_i1.p1 TRINITY_DN48163_c0_g1~~TRINITY_DN48163_c0_g1_i1.p1  ORF type:complete len:860 (-),score=158.36 TRINITY_DN48163_c0_g1_i1:388-2967(-)
MLRLPILETDRSSSEGSSIMDPSPGTDSSPVSKWQHPPSFYCPISQQCMHDPVVLSDGHTYERRHIQRWLRNRNTSPVSGVELDLTDIFPNHALRNAIEEYFQQVFNVHRRAIQKTIAGPESDSSPRSLWSNALLLRTIDALMQCSLLVNADLSTESVLRKIMEEAKTLLGAEVASVFLVDEERDELYSTINSTSTMIRIPVNMGIAGHVASTGESIVIPNAYEDERFNKAVDKKTGFRTRNILCVPLKAKKGVIGVVQLINKTSSGVLVPEDFAGINNSRSSDSSGDESEKKTDERDFSTEDMHFLQVFASQAATAITNSFSMEHAPELLEHQQNDQAPSPAASWTVGCCEAMKRCNRMLRGAFDGSQSDESPAQATRSERTPRRTDTIRFDNINVRKSQVSKQEVPDTLGAEADPVAVTKVLNAAVEGWQLNTLQLADLTGNKPLSTLGVYLFDRLGLVDHFHLNRAKLTSFFMEIEKGYDDKIQYHNKSHATSVMFAMYALLQHGGIAKAASAGFTLEGHNEESKTKLVTLTCLLAAAVHDFEHKGLSNDFLVKTCDERAVRYNDQHVNEHHHAAAAFAVLYRPENNFLESLQPADTAFIRRLVIDLVLGTDMAHNGKILNAFTEKLDSASQAASSSSMTGFLPSSADDATLLLQISMKCSDLGHLALPWDQHVQWVCRLEGEFFAQGDQELKHGLPISFLMDRTKPGASSTQVGFFDFVVNPLFNSLVRGVPAARQMLSGVSENYQRWKDGATVSDPPCIKVTACSHESTPPEDQEEKDDRCQSKTVSFRTSSKSSQFSLSSSVPITEGEPGTSSMELEPKAPSSKRKSGRSRQRAARWWASVRQRTPSPYPEYF